MSTHPGDRPSAYFIGTAFDYFTANIADNPAARDYMRFKDKSDDDSAGICKRRQDLEQTVRLVGEPTAIPEDAIRELQRRRDTITGRVQRAADSFNNLVMA